MMSISTCSSKSQRPSLAGSVAWGRCVPWCLLRTRSYTNFLHTYTHTHVHREPATERGSCKLASITYFCRESKSLPPPKQDSVAFQQCCSLHINSITLQTWEERRFFVAVLQDLLSCLNSSLNKAAVGQQAKGDWFYMNACERETLWP